MPLLFLSFIFIFCFNLVAHLVITILYIYLNFDFYQTILFVSGCCAWGEILEEEASCCDSRVQEMAHVPPQPDAWLRQGWNRYGEQNTRKMWVLTVLIHYCDFIAMYIYVSTVAVQRCGHVRLAARQQRFLFNDVYDGWPRLHGVHEWYLVFHYTVKPAFCLPRH